MPLFGATLVALGGRLAGVGAALVAPIKVRWVDERLLRQAFEAIKEVQQATEIRFRTDMRR